MIHTPTTLSSASALSVHIDGEATGPTYGNNLVQKAHLAFYEACLNDPDTDIELRVNNHAVLIRRAGERDIDVSDYGTLLGFSSDGDDSETRRLTVRIPRPLAARLEEHAGHRGMNAFIAEAIREKLQRS